MKLTSASLSQLLKELRGGGEPSSKRKQPRVGLRVKTTVRTQGRGEPVVWVRDISAGGANFVGPLQFEPQDKVQLVASPDGNETIDCRVVHCRQLQPNLFVTGVRFAR
jgi:hypothetical protein